MMQYIDVSGKTEEEAIEKALVQLAMDRDEVSVEILERAKPGFLGIGATPAVVRVSYDDGREEPAPAAKEEFRPEQRKSKEEREREAAATKAEKERLAAEIMDACNGTGASVKRREDLYKMAESNRAFSHYRF